MFDVNLTTAPAYAVVVDGTAFRFADANQAVLEKTGLVRGFHQGLTPADCFPPAIAAIIEARYRACCATGQACSYLSDSIFPGTANSWTTTLIPVSDHSGTITSIFAILTDATQQSEEAQQPEKPQRSKTPCHPQGREGDEAALAIGAIDGGFWVYEIATANFETSRSLAELLAGPGHETLDLAEYVGHIHVDDMKTVNLLAPKAHRSSVDFRVITHDGRTRWLQSNRRMVHDDDGTPLRVVGLVLDITARKTAMRTLEAEASTDSLTGLMNRRGFERIARQTLRASRGTARGPGLVLIDIDGFKAVNDHSGHLAGDELLRQVARRLSRAVRRGDVLARFGGDEFAVLSMDEDGAYALEQRIDRSFAKPFQIGDRSTFVGASVGCSVKLETDKRIEQLVERADEALYLNKAARRALRA